jgi:chitodextrinase
MVRRADHFEDANRRSGALPMLSVKALLLYPLLALALAACGAAVPQGATPNDTNDTIAPSTPGNLTATAAGSTGANLSWSASTDNVGVTGYIVRRSGVQVGTSTTTSYLDTGLSAGQTYSYTVAARDAAGNTSPNSPATSVTTAGTPPPPSNDKTPPSMPTGVTATAINAFQIILSWNASTDDVGVTDYVIRRDGVQVSTRATTTFADTGLSPSTPYNYTVAARDAAGNVSTQSSIASVTTPAASGSQTPLALLAASLQAGQWATLPTLNINPALLAQGASGFITGDAESIKWDPVTRQLFFLGMDHQPGAGQRFVSYSESTNTWQVLPQTSWMAGAGVNHGYDHKALDVANRYLYVRADYVSRSVYRYQIDTKVWEQVQDNNVVEYPSCCGGWDYFPELNGVVWYQGGEVVSGTTYYAGLFLRDDSTGSWRRLGSRLTYVSGMYNNFAEYNPKHKVVIFGGGFSNRNLYKLDSSGGVTPLKPAPVDLGNRAGVVTTDPVSNNYLVLSSTGNSFYSYDVASDTWQLLPTAPIFQPVVNAISTFGVVATPLSTHGVTLFVQCTDSNCVVRLYKHS